MQCERQIEMSRSNSLRALYGSGGLSRLRQCGRKAAMTFTANHGIVTRTLCRQHASDEFLRLGCIDDWTISDAKTGAAVA